MLTTKVLSRFLVLIPAFGLLSCGFGDDTTPSEQAEITLPASAELLDGSEQFSGFIEGAAYGDGSVFLSSSLGSQCLGQYSHNNKQLGAGEFKCDDGREGSFDFISTGTFAEGAGEIAGNRFLFRVGSVSERAH